MELPNLKCTITIRNLLTVDVYNIENTTGKCNLISSGKAKLLKVVERYWEHCEILQLIDASTDLVAAHQTMWESWNGI